MTAADPGLALKDLIALAAADTKDTEPAGADTRVGPYDVRDTPRVGPKPTRVAAGPRVGPKN
jgi:hypothetical protein